MLLLLVAAALPCTVYTMRVAYAAHDIAFEEEARTLGASRANVLARVHLPLVAPGLARAAFLAFLVGGVRRSSHRTRWKSSHRGCSPLRLSEPLSRGMVPNLAESCE